MGSRESDIYDLFIAPWMPGQELLVRAQRGSGNSKIPPQHLWEAAEAAPMIGPMTITVPRNPGQRGCS